MSTSTMLPWNCVLFKNTFNAQGRHFDIGGWGCKTEHSGDPRPGILSSVMGAFCDGGQTGICQNVLRCGRQCPMSNRTDRPQLDHYEAFP